MPIVAIIQARLGSTRLPGKVLKPIAGKPVLWHLLDRLKYCKNLEQVIVATTTQKRDGAIEQFCSENSVFCYRGSEQDVLDRYYQAAKKFRADPIVRITGDCPVIDPTIVDEVMERYFDGGYDFCGLAGEFPNGLDCTMFSFAVLEDTWKNAELPSEREHVCPYMEKHPEIYKNGRHEKFQGLSHHRWTLDEEADLLFLQQVFHRLYKPGSIFLTQDILNLLENEPRLMEINRGLVRDEGYMKSLKEDEEYLRNKQK
ncbi:MAG TPA: glycosyltransferase family protein [Pyrinomonadaceae bacterium]|nr:glycosyltransferase family protein [Pyrinomonadaceae bacterium]